MTAPTAWRSRIVGHARRSPAKLRANPRNWRTHPPEQREAVSRLLDEVGWVQDVILNRRTDTLIDGHLRVDLALERGEKTIPVVLVDLSPEEEALILASLDPVTGMAGMDGARLDALLSEIALGDDELSALLLSLVRSAAPQDRGVSPDDVPTIDPEDLYVERGQVYLLGEHRMMCGDATNGGDVAALLAEAKPLLMVTDPPYGVEYDPMWRAAAGVNRNRRKMGKVSNDERADWREAWALFPGDVAYVWHAGIHADVVATGIAASGYEIRSQIVWAKDRFALGRGSYHWQHEPCWYAVRRSAKAHWIGDRSQSTVWNIPARDDGGHGHGTQKPVECMERPIRNHRGDVFDPFMGSGTTLIASERAHRRCFGMEIDPRYAQVAITRWERYSGQKARRAP